MKFSNPFGKGEVWISQTYHTNTSNKAVDFGNLAVGTPVYAIADGTISTTSAGGGSYCVLSVKDTTFKIFYVHTYKWLAKGTVVKKGQKICEIAPTSLTGYPVHLHLGIGIYQLSFRNLMDYMDRSIIFRTKYADIKKSWFNNTENLNWALFKDLHYLPDPIIDPCESIKKENEALKLALAASQGQVTALSNTVNDLTLKNNQLTADSEFLVQLSSDLKRAITQYGS